MLGDTMAYDRAIMDCLAIIKSRGKKKLMICIGVTIDTNTWTDIDNKLQLF